MAKVCGGEGMEWPWLPMNWLPESCKKGCAQVLFSKRLAISVVRWFIGGCIIGGPHVGLVGPLHGCLYCVVPYGEYLPLLYVVEAGSNAVHTVLPLIQVVDGIVDKGHR